MGDKTWGERAEDAFDLVAFLLKLTSLLAAVLIPAGAVAYCINNHISVDDISQQVRRFINGVGDEKGFVKTMHDDTAFSQFNAAEMLDLGHRTCERLRNGAGPNDLINSLDGGVRNPV